MKRFLTTTTALAAIFAFTNSASAADPIDYSHDWSGFYGGIFGGYAFGDWSAKGDFDEGPPDTKFKLSPDGGVLGLTIGHNWQTDQLVLGIESELGYNSANDKRFVVPSPDNFGKVNYGMYGTLAGRFGYAFDNTLLFAKAGGVIADINNRGGDLDGGAIDPTDFAQNKKASFGLLVGAGAEYAVNENWSIKAEYDFMAFENKKDVNQDGDLYKFRNQLHVIKVGVNFNF